MLNITLPDGSKKSFDTSITGLDVAASIGAGLAKAALAIEVDGELKDLSYPIEQDAHVSIITEKNTEIALELLRHDTAHVMAEAVQALWPGTQVTIGPSIENGFYYDFGRDKPFTPEDLEKIEQKMAEIIDDNQPFEREVWSRNEAIEYFKQIGETFKVELIEDLAETEEISVYRQGQWLDLCRGPHLPSTGKIGKHFKLMSVAGSYWRGDSNREQLQRIYGTAWFDKKQLAAYLERLAEAERRDHRKLGKEMDLFHLQPEAPGMVFWHANGWALYRQLEAYMRKRLEDNGYIEVRTPQLINRELWEASGHWDKFREDMFVTGDLDGENNIAIKPMNCPAHIQIFNQGLKSYRDLPLRMAEFGSCHRNEASGALHGIMRVRGFVQDDAHIFCSEEQIISETKAFCDLLKSVYKDIMGDVEMFVKFSDRPEKRAGSDDVWDKAEAALRGAAEAAGIELKLNPGEGAFYGPKLEFVLRDALGRDWQCGTLQADFVLPERLGANYIGEDGQKHHPVMLHRAVLGTFERFIGILIEHYAGRFPLWLAPKQIVVAPITSDIQDYAIEVAERFKDAGLRVEVDTRNEKINYKIREHSHAKVPVILVVGAREKEEKTVAMRRLGGKTQEVLALNEVFAKLVNEAENPAFKK
ncbi:MAG: threonine--tRNA ligase [Alphaproteobacteria bacterium]